LRELFRCLAAGGAPVSAAKQHEMRVELIHFEIAAARHRIVLFLSQSRNDLSDSS
jgi:hypothetical protein